MDRSLLHSVKACIQNYRWLLKHSPELLKTCPLDCYEFGHSWTPYCSTALKDVFLSSLKYSFKVYATLYLATAVLKRRKPEFYKNVVWKDILRSTAFLTANASVFVFAFCAWRRIAGFYFYMNVFVCAVPLNMVLMHIEQEQSRVQRGLHYTSFFRPALAASALCIFIERESRRSLLALYMTNLGIETLYRMMRARSLVVDVPHGQVIIFSAALAGFLHLYKNKRQTLDNFSVNVMSLLFDDTHKVQVITERAFSFLPPSAQALLRKLFQLPVFTIKHRLCEHQNGCFASAIKKYMSRFIVGFSLHALIRLPTNLLPLLRRKTTLSQWLFSKDNISVGALLAGVSSIQQVVSCVLIWWRGKTNPKFDSLLSGALAGVALLHYKSSAIALYALIRLIDTWCRMKVDEGKLPHIKNAYVYLYAFSTAILFHSAVWEPHNIRPAYWKFMLNLTGQKFKLINRRVLDKIFGLNASKLYPDYWPAYDKRFTDLSIEHLNDITSYLAQRAV